MTGRSWPVSPAAVALGLVDASEADLAARLLADDARFRGEVERLRATGSALGRLDERQWALAPAPPLRPLAEVRPAAAPAAPPRRTARARRLVLAASSAAALLAACFAGWVALHDRDGAPAPLATTLALHPLPGIKGQAELKLDGTRTHAELLGTGLRPSGPHDHYEAWLADDRGRMVSMGTFRVSPSGRVDVRMAIVVDLSAYALIDVSLERDDGNPAHSAISVFRAHL
ncbi:MAG TPA: anti-sigma factor [Baekduia sp.]|uniref:anti-sigma factor n=1 Tax=Baekduia sp. TaxID=2600305 RepID=UPI002D7848EC|nr:anti-sigma factor [Baekduia sp.]HET6509143.1 anti-sigma factor [Baekduia sp.]